MPKEGLRPRPRAALPRGHRGVHRDPRVRPVPGGEVERRPARHRHPLDRRQGRRGVLQLLDARDVREGPGPDLRRDADRAVDLFRDLRPDRSGDTIRSRARSTGPSVRTRSRRGCTSISSGARQRTRPVRPVEEEGGPPRAGTVPSLRRGRARRPRSSGSTVTEPRGRSGGRGTPPRPGGSRARRWWPTGSRSERSGGDDRLTYFATSPRWAASSGCAAARARTAANRERPSGRPRAPRGSIARPQPSRGPRRRTRPLRAPRSVRSPCARWAGGRPRPVPGTLRWRPAASSRANSSRVGNGGRRDESGEPPGAQLLREMRRRSGPSKRIRRESDLLEGAARANRPARGTGGRAPGSVRRRARRRSAEPASLEPARTSRTSSVHRTRQPPVELGRTAAALERATPERDARTSSTRARAASTRRGRPLDVLLGVRGLDVEEAEGVGSPAGERFGDRRHRDPLRPDVLLRQLVAGRVDEPPVDEEPAGLALARGRRSA